MQLEEGPLKTEPSCTDTEHRGTGYSSCQRDRSSYLIYYNLIFSRWRRDGSGYHLEFGYTYAFLLLFGAHITRQYL